LNRHHHVKQERVQKPCCDDPSHWRWKLTCTCGWEAFVGREDNTAQVMLYHRVHALEELLGIRFGITQVSA
jgi:hypothetical protein